MSEKRFVLCKKGDVEYIEDNGCVQLYGFDVLCEMLNEFNDENKELKSEIEQSDLISEDIVCADIQHQLLKVTDENKELKKENEQLKQKIQRWKTLYEIKDKEVTARVKRLNEICNQYKYAITFDKDIDPNDAVNILCDRILQTEVE